MASQLRHLAPNALTVLRIPTRGIVMIAIVMIAMVTACSPPAERTEARRALARWEDRRLAPQDSLSRFLTSPDAHVRVAALRTAGLIGRSSALPAMLAALRDRSQAVRCEAAFSLGVLGDPAAVTALGERVADDRRAVRIAAMQGLALLPGEGVALPSPLFGPAGGGTSREALAAWDALIHVAATCDRDSLAPVIAAGLRREEHAIRWRALRCVERAPDSSLVDVIVPLAHDGDLLVRTHALRALGHIGGDAALAAVVGSGEQLSRLRSYDRVRCQVAVMRALGDLAGPALAADTTGAPTSLSGRAAALLTAAAGAAEPFASEEALRAMARVVATAPLPPEAATQESLLPVWRIRMARTAREKLESGTSPAVRSAAVEAYAALRGRGWDRDGLREALADASDLVQAAWLRALAHTGSAAAPASPLVGAVAALTDRGTEPPSPVVRVAAAEALAACYRDRKATFPDQPDLQAHAAIAALGSLATAAREDPDFTVRATCAGLLGEFPLGWTLDELRRAYPGDGLAAAEVSDLRLACLDAIGAIAVARRDTPTAPAALAAPTGGLRCAPAWLTHERLPSGTNEATRDSLRAWNLDVAPHAGAMATLLRGAFDDDDLRVRLRARQVAGKAALLPAALIPTEASLRATLPAFLRAPAQPPVALPHHAPRVRCVTDRGTFTIQLDGERAPNTCATFLHLVRDGFYDGQVFHRVVPDFVIQGGDPRGDGWGGPGYTLRSEWSRATFARGAVGLAHSGKDTGGSQFFVCHSPQPHLDGLYTLFGEVVDGMAVVDAIQVGDHFRCEVVTD